MGRVGRVLRLLMVVDSGIWRYRSPHDSRIGNICNSSLQCLMSRGRVRRHHRAQIELSIAKVLTMGLGRLLRR